MDSITNFILEQQQHLSPNTQIRVSVGKFINYPHILDTRLPVDTIKNILDVLRKTLIVNSKQENQRIYKHQDMSYIYSKHGELNTSKQILVSQQYQGSNGFGLYASLEKTRSRNLEEFPCRLQYTDTVDCSRVLHNISNLFQLVTIAESDQNDNRHTRIELLVSCQNIHEEKMRKTLQQVLRVIENHRNTHTSE